jgi:hypothetical protein
MASTPAAKARTELNVAIGYVDRAARRLAGEPGYLRQAHTLERLSGGAGRGPVQADRRRPAPPPGGRLMAACDVLYYDPTHAGPRDGWRPCTAHGNVWTDPDQVLRFICTQHRRQLTALHAAGLAGQVRWGRPCLSTGSVPSASGGEGL